MVESWIFVAMGTFVDGVVQGRELDRGHLARQRGRQARPVGSDGLHVSTETTPPPEDLPGHAVVDGGGGAIVLGQRAGRHARVVQAPEQPRHGVQISDALNSEMVSQSDDTLAFRKKKGARASKPLRRPPVGLREAEP